MPMLSPSVWFGHAPPYALRIEAPDIAAQVVQCDRDTVCLPSLESAVATLRILGATQQEIHRLTESARLQPQSQQSYCAVGEFCECCNPPTIEEWHLDRHLADSSRAGPVTERY